jgi:hypothetical protein
VWLLSLAALLLIFGSLLMAVLADGTGASSSVRGFAGVYAIVLTAVGAVALIHVRRLARSSDILEASSAEPTSSADLAPDGLRIAATIPPTGWPPITSLARAPRRERPRQAQAIAAACDMARRRSSPRTPAVAAQRPRPPVVSVRVARPRPSMPASWPDSLAAGARSVAPMTRAQVAALQVGVAGLGRSNLRPARRGPGISAPNLVPTMTGAPRPTLSRSVVGTVPLRSPIRQ